MADSCGAEVFTLEAGAEVPLDHEAAEMREAEAEPLGLDLVWVLKPDEPAMPDEGLPDLDAAEVQTGEVSAVAVDEVQTGAEDVQTGAEDDSELTIGTELTQVLPAEVTELTAQVDVQVVGTMTLVRLVLATGMDTVLVALSPTVTVRTLQVVAVAVDSVHTLETPVDLTRVELQVDEPEEPTETQVADEMGVTVVVPMGMGEIVFVPIAVVEPFF